jgi:CubicO group peptidase (beta-lactamase class C family)
MNAALLDSLSARLEAGAHGQVHSLLIARHGRLVLERYYQGWSADDLHPLYSVTKSVTALLVGSARDRGADLDLDGRLLGFFPGEQRLANPSDWKDAITLADLLTMRAGFSWDESAAPYREPGNPTTQLAQSGDWIRFMLDLPMAEPPGTAFRYNSGCSVLIGAIVTVGTGERVTDFARARLFDPLGIKEWEWERGPDEVTNTGWGLSLRPRDLATIGQLVLDNGEWRGRRVVSEHWIRVMTTARVSVSRGFGYGYQWWLLPPQAGIGAVTFAWGWGDQFLFIVPALHLIVVTTGGNYATGDDDQALRFVPRFVFAAVDGGAVHGRHAP